MKIQYMSDLHLEMNRIYIKPEDLIPSGDVLVLAGDNFYIKNIPEDYINYFSEHWKQTIIIMGNHEHYNNKETFYLNADTLNIDLKSNVKLINNDVFKYEDVTFICTTLWSNISPINSYVIQNSLADFKYIIKNCNYKRLKINDFNYLHRKSLKFLIEALKKVDGKCVVITHHAPTHLVNPEEYKNSNLNEGFVVELHDLIYDSNIDYWIYGHTHRNVDAEINGTKIITNQYGYYHEHNIFQYDKIVEI